ncbi:MAG: DUF1343 domain-containing protein [Candidatus Alcyoniella australis]|nr:DUF1343 domain-containing protein [Candidatus Alcyoniella australis]
MRVLCGLDRLAAGEYPNIRGKRIALLTHAAALTRELASAADVLIDGVDAELVQIHSPEHGLFGTLQDQVAAQDTMYRGIEVDSLYGGDEQSLQIDPQRLAEIDLLVIDLVDIGARYYTYAATMAHALRAAGQAGIPALVLDRPNPLGGEQVEGNLLEPEYQSFVGLFPIPVRHGMTLGELAIFMTRHLGLYCEVTVLQCQGWKRSMLFNQTDLRWIAPSPNMPSFETALVYPGACLVEGTNLSEGRGTTMPFLQIGAPFISAGALAERLNLVGLPGVRFRPISFNPVFGKHAANDCDGVFCHVIEQHSFRPYRTGLALLWAANKVAGSQFNWRTEPYEFVSDRLAIDMLCGTDRVRRMIDAHAALDELLAVAEEVDADFMAARAEILLYR